MGVIGHWRRSALGAGGVALLLPLGLALGVALTTALGGHDGLHALGEVFSGPSSPGRGAPGQQPGLESARAVPAIPLPPRVRRTAATVSTQRSSAGTSTGAPVHAAPLRAPSGGGGTRPTRAPSSGGGGGSAHPGSPPAHQPAPPSHTAVHDAGQQAADQVKAAPAPVGPAAGDAAQTVVDLIP